MRDRRTAGAGIVLLALLCPWATAREADDPTSRELPGGDLLIADFSLCELVAAARDEYAYWLFPRASHGAVLWSELEQEGWLTGDDVGRWLQKHLGGRRIYRKRLASEEYLPHPHSKWWRYRWYWRPEQMHASAPEPEPEPEPKPATEMRQRVKG